MKKIVIFGSTGSIGSSLIDIITKYKKNYKIELLTANANYKKLIKQAKFFNVKNIITLVAIINLIIFILNFPLIFN